MLVLGLSALVASAQGNWDRQRNLFTRLQRRNDDPSTHHRPN